MADSTVQEIAEHLKQWWIGTYRVAPQTPGPILPRPSWGSEEDRTAKYELKNERTKRFLQHEEQDFGINLGWTDDASNATAKAKARWFFSRRGDHAGPIRYGESIAVGNGRSPSFLRYENRNFGINLCFSESPVFEWKILGGKPGTPVHTEENPLRPVALYNARARQPLIYFDRDVGGDIGWPNSETLFEKLKGVLLSVLWESWGPAVLDFLGLCDRPVRNYSSLNITEADARTLQRHLYGNEWPTLLSETAKRMVTVNTGERLRYYRMRINDKASYTIKLGQHRIIMIDSGPDKDMLDGNWDALVDKLGYSNEDEATFVDGSPNSVGFKDEDIMAVKVALNEAGATGLVIVGVHAPPLNPWGNEFPHYFRETEHATVDPKEIEGYLRRQSQALFGPTSPIPPDKVLPNWSRTGTLNFKRGTIDDLLDYAISKDRANEFLRCCAGVNLPRPVDLVLCGHGHNRVEYRIAWDKQTAELLFYTDFYTENPTVYYRSRHREVDEPVSVRIVPGASGGKPAKQTSNLATDVWKTWWQVDVSPYATPLNNAPNKKQWWESRRPFVMQTAAVGPIDANQRRDSAQNQFKPGPAFSGYRVVSVVDNEINSIRYVTTGKHA